ncbi:acyl-CoA dehydrogenase [Sandarakinorhabdus cyanobacteriorum]|uniref:Acyl-CoA dehydrogenase n=1 Tax=Sandarakinorhabdus cyanobacteriorum TaxID=1981098 RepID=A0A255YGK5_9SPHN|nr:acyl-CoA dehydrogenase family protein [Sandarakinorhabdus cyanobacteriorum]OYQ28321.1 acyl-CoA dehydrogenase [Sandarakinorhabdus cyanobacteriorum]
MDAETFGLLKDQLARYVEERLIPAEDAVEDGDDIPADIVAEFKAMGLFGLSVPEAYGGLGLTMAEEAQLVRTLCRASITFRSLIGTTVGIGSQGIMIDGTPEQKAEWLPKFATGEAIASFALTEPGAGSDAASLRAQAVRDGDFYRISGTKRYITNAPRATVFTLMARTDAQVKGAAGISAFIVPADSPGISLGKPDRKMGQRGAKTCDVILDDVLVPAANIIGGVPGQGFRTAMKVLDRGRIHIAAVALGMADRLIETSLAYAQSREQFGQAISQFQLVQAMLADMEVDRLTSEALLERTAARFDAGQATNRECSVLKLHASEAVGRIADKAVQIHGGAGYMAEYKVERFYRDVRLLRIYEGTSQIQQTIIAKAMLRGV